VQKTGTDNKNYKRLKKTEKDCKKLQKLNRTEQQFNIGNFPETGKQYNKKIGL